MTEAARAWVTIGVVIGDEIRWTIAVVRGEVAGKRRPMKDHIEKH